MGSRDFVRGTSSVHIKYKTYFSHCSTEMLQKPQTVTAPESREGRGLRRAQWGCHVIPEPVEQG